MKYSLQQIGSILGIDTPLPEIYIDHFLTDSRKLTTPSTTLFFALQSTRRDGHLFIPELYNKGVRYFVVSQKPAFDLYPEACFLKVDNALYALQRIAAWQRSNSHAEVIGITGSNGKTIVKEWLYQLLHADKNIVRSPKSYNSQLGVALSVLQLDAANELAIFEAGISLPGEMEKLEKMIQPRIGILTNIGEAHSEGFTGIEEKLKEKLKLFKRAEIIIANGDDTFIKNQIEALHIPFFSWGWNKENTLQILDVIKKNHHTEINLQFEEECLHLTIPFTDKASIDNAVTCCATLLLLNISPQTIAARMEKLHPVSMRLEFKKAINNCILINDSYSADKNALTIALDFLQQQAKGHRKTLILSDLIGSDDDAFDEYLIRQLKDYQIDRFIGVGPKMQKTISAKLQESQICSQAAFYLSTEEFIKKFHSSWFKEEVILIKGGRKFEFERIAALLEQKQHQTVLEINLDAIAHNVKAFQQLLKPGIKIMAMVKAFGYGSGGAEIAHVLQYHKIDYLGVAYADEGIELREAGITLPIMVMNPEQSAFDAITENHLEPVMYSISMLQAFQDHLLQAGLEKYPVHIEVETGMNRLGFSEESINDLGELLSNSNCIKVQSVFSHLAASEDPNEDAFSRQQGTMLLRAAEALQKSLGYDFIKHIANSAAIIRLPELHLDMVRLGIGLYGIETEKNNVHLIPAATLRSTISQIKKLAKGDTVGYNRRGLADKDTVIATVRIGYADGYSRKLGNGVGKMLIRGRFAPVMGTVCMDMTMIDVTQIPQVQEGDEVIIFGQDLSIQQVAAWAGTIPYEIMTGISQRVQRVYYGEG